MTQHPLLLLHGALGSSRQFELFQTTVQSVLTTHTLDFSGHGGLPLSDSPFRIELFAEDVLRWMKERHFQEVDIFGYSMGGYVGLFLARHYPEKVHSVFTLATKFQWNESTAANEARLLDPSTISRKVPAFAEQLSQRHSPQDWRKVVEKTAEMITQLGTHPALSLDDITSIKQQVQIGVGDRDVMVTIEESVEVYRALQHGRMVILPSTPHQFEKTSVKRLTAELTQFFYQ